jgi:hypothetical protein
MQIDVETLNALLALLTKEIIKYPTDSKESMALFTFKEILTNG